MRYKSSQACMPKQKAKFVHKKFALDNFLVPQVNKMIKNVLNIGYLS